PPDLAMRRNAQLSEEGRPFAEATARPEVGLGDGVRLHDRRAVVRPATARILDGMEDGVAVESEGERHLGWKGGRIPGRAPAKRDRLLLDVVAVHARETEAVAPECLAEGRELRKDGVAGRATGPVLSRKGRDRLCREWRQCKQHCRRDE